MNTQHRKPLLDNYRPGFIAVAMLLLTLFAQGQQYQHYPQYGVSFNRIMGDSSLHIPNGPTPSLRGGDTDPGAMFLRITGTDTVLVVWTGFTWKDLVSSGGGSVSSVFGRTGAVTALGTDYSAFYPQLGGSYSNPSWITGLAWSKISGTPTTLSGYGITDATSNARTSLSLTTTGTSGAATYNNTTGVFNIPNYAAGGGSGTVNSGNQYRLGYYATTGTALSEAAAITGSRLLVSDANGVPTHSTVTTTEANYLSGVTSSVQTQFTGKQATLVSGTNIKTINSTSILGSGNITISGAASDEANVMDFFADSTGSRGSALAFQNALASGKDVYVPKGRYKIDSTLALRTGQKIRGSGTLFTTTAGSGASYAGMFHIMTVAKFSFVDGLTFYGTAGKQAGFGSTYSAQNGIQIIGDSVNIMNCKFIAFTGSGILGMNFVGSFQPNTFGQITNCFFDNCTAGVYNYLGGDYQTLSNSVAVNCYYGVLQNTANAKVIGCTLDYNNIGFAGLYNSDRGVIIGTSMNHNSDALKIISATSNGYMISGCTFYYGHITLTDADRVVFTGCSFGVNGNITVNGTAPVNRVTFLNSYVTTGLTTNWVTGGTGVIINPGLQSYNISRSVDTIYRKAGQDSVFYKLGAVEFAIKDSTGGGGGGSSALSALTAASGANTISNTGKQLWKWDALAADTALVLASNNTTASGGNSHVLAGIDLRGANATINQSTYGLTVQNRKTGTGSTNYGLHVGASGGGTNIGLSVFAGALAVNTTADQWNIASKPYSDKAGLLLQSFNSTSQATITYSQTGVGNWSSGLTGDSRFAINNGGDFTGTHLFLVDATGRISVGSHNALSKLDINGAIRVRDSIIMARSAVVSASTSDSVVVRIASTGQLATRAQSDIAGGGTPVTSVSGTTNRISVTGTTTPVVDISSSYVGQSSITTHGTITSGGLGTGAVIGGVTMTLGSDASNDIYYRNTSGILTRLANGTTGQFLKATTSAAPSWGTAVTSVAAGYGTNFSTITGTGSVIIDSTKFPDKTQPNVWTGLQDFRGSATYITPSTTNSQSTVRINTVAGGQAVQLGTLSTTSFGAVTLGLVTAGATNYTLASDGSSATLNALTGISFRIANGAAPNVMQMTSQLRVGINQNTPLYKLDVTGSGRFTDSVLANNFYKIRSADVSASSSDSVVVRRASDGLLMTRAQSDVAGAGTNTSGTYSPTISAGSNVASSTTSNCFYQRIGNIVHVTGQISITPALTATNTACEITLPVASNLAASTDLSGIVAEAGGTSGVVVANGTTDKAIITYTSSFTSARSVPFSFSYSVLP